MAKKFDVEIVTAQGLFWRGEADMVIMQTVEGEMAVMHGHIPAVAALKPSPLRIRDEEGKIKEDVLKDYINDLYDKSFNVLQDPTIE